MNIYEKMSESKLVPVVVINDINDIDSTMNSLVEGGIKMAEICYRTNCASKALKIIAQKYSDVLVGAGTIINDQQCFDAIENGAKFIVSPGYSSKVHKVCKDNNIPYIPGIVTPTEIITAMDNGLTYLKFFPAGEFGGLKTLKAYHSAFPNLKFMPTGGVDNSNLSLFASSSFIFAIGGSWLLKGDVINTCKEAVKIIKESKN